MLIPETTNSNLPGFAKYHPEELWLEVDAETQHKAEELANTQIYPALRSRVYLNQVAHSSLLKGLNEEIKEKIDEEIEVKIISKDSNQEEWLRNWVFINGSYLECEITSEAKTSKKRLVLIPLNPSEDSHIFSVPREWVDIEDWAADYYLSVHINPEENWLRLRGFKTHKQLKQEAEYNPYNFSYEIAPENLITDFSVLLLSLELATDTKPQWETQEELLPQVISQKEAKAILSKWGKPSPYSLRILMDFNKWVALIQNPDLKEELYQKVNYSHSQSLEILQKYKEYVLQILQDHPETNQYSEDIFYYLLQQIKNFKNWNNKQNFQKQLIDSLTGLLNDITITPKPPTLMETRSEGNNFQNVAEHISNKIIDLYNPPEQKLWSPRKWLDERISEVVSGWKEIDSPMMSGAIAMGNEENTPSSIKGFEKELVITQESYILKVSQYPNENDWWRFQLERKDGEPIPKGTKLILLQENLEHFEDNKDVADTENRTTLYIDVEPYPGEGLIWKTEPLPNNYQTEILWF